MHVHLYSSLRQCVYHQWHTSGCNNKSEISVSKKHTGTFPPSLLNMCIEGQLKTLFFIVFNLMIFAVGLAPVYFGSRKRTLQSSLGLLKLLSRNHIAPFTYISLAKASHMAKPNFKLAGKCSPVMCWGQRVRIFMNIQNVYHREEMQHFRQYFSIQLSIKNKREREDSKLLSSQKTIQKRKRYNCRKWTEKLLMSLF